MATSTSALAADKSHTQRGLVATVSELAALGQQVAKQNLGARKLSRTFLSGQYASHFRGRGMDYLETRPYTEGDDIRNIDWRVTARSGKTHSKVFIEERDRPILIVGDFSPSLYFGTRNAFKSVVAARIGACLAFSGIKRGDRIGCLLQTPEGSTDVRARGGRNHTMQVLQALANATAAVPSQTVQAPAPNTSLSKLLEQACRSAPTGSTIILLSDFYQDIEHFNKPLFRLAQHTDIVAFHLFDPLEKMLPLGRNVPLSDGTRRLKVFTQKSDQQQQVVRFENHCNELKTLFEKMGQALVHVSTEHDIAKLLAGH